MIKRLKWNVLHGGGGGEESDGGLSSSDDSEMDDPVAADALMQKLVENDPIMSQMLYDKLEAIAPSDSDSDDSDDGSDAEHAVLPSRAKRQARGLRRSNVFDSSDEEKEEDGDQHESDEGSGNDIGDESEHDYEPSAGDKEGDDLEDQEATERSDGGSGEIGEEQKFVEWQECVLCPGKRFLNTKEADAHLASRLHLKRVARSERLAEKDTTEPSVTVQGEQEGAIHDVEQGTTPEDAENNAEKEKRDQKRKAATKRKLKALKRRKWEKRLKAELENGNAEANGVGIMKSIASEGTSLSGERKNDKGDCSEEKDEAASNETAKIPQGKSRKRKSVDRTKKKKPKVNHLASEERPKGNREQEAPVIKKEEALLPDISLSGIEKKKKRKSLGYDTPAEENRTAQIEGKVKKYKLAKITESGRKVPANRLGKKNRKASRREVAT